MPNETLKPIIEPSYLLLINGASITKNILEYMKQYTKYPIEKYSKSADRLPF